MVPPGRLVGTTPSTLVSIVTLTTPTLGGLVAVVVVATLNGMGVEFVGCTATVVDVANPCVISELVVVGRLLGTVPFSVLVGAGGVLVECAGVLGEGVRDVLGEGVLGNGVLGDGVRDVLGEGVLGNSVLGDGVRDVLGEGVLGNGVLGDGVRDVLGEGVTDVVGYTRDEQLSR